MTATPPSVVSADDLIVRSAPRNQRASPSPGCSAMAVGDASCASGVDMGASLLTRRPFVQFRRGTGVAARKTPLRRSEAERDPGVLDVCYAEPQREGPVGYIAAVTCPARPHYRIEAPPVVVPDLRCGASSHARDVTPGVPPTEMCTGGARSSKAGQLIPVEGGGDSWAIELAARRRARRG